ncbi:MAG: hypothetical protein DCC75_01805, partial [Proteobacteria bacterium]
MAIDVTSSQAGAAQSLAPKTLAQLLGLSYLDKLPEPNPPRELARGDFDRIVGSWGRQFLTIPLQEENGHIIVATSDPLNVVAVDQLRL